VRGVQSSVDVRTFEPQHDANPDRVIAGLAAGRCNGPDPTAAAAATEAFPHGNFPRTTRTAATAIPAKPDPSAVAAGAASSRGQAARSGTPGFAVPATGTVRANVSGHPAATVGPPTEDTGQTQRYANRNATRAARTARAACTATARATGTASRGTV